MQNGGKDVPPAVEPMRVFVTYRRHDDPAFSGRLFDRLESAFGSDEVFRDLDSIRKGLDFVQEINAALDQADVVVALIGPKWDTARLAAEGDYVRMELVGAIERGLPILPIALADTVLPDPAEIPEVLRPVLRRNASRIRHDPDFRSDADRVIKEIRALALVEKKKKQDEAERARRKAAAKKKQEEAARLARDAAAAEQRRREREERLAQAELEADMKQREADRIAEEHARRAAELRRQEDELAARRLAQEQAQVAELDRRQREAKEAAKVAQRERDRLRDSLGKTTTGSEARQKEPATGKGQPRTSPKPPQVSPPKPKPRADTPQAAISTPSTPSGESFPAPMLVVCGPLAFLVGLALFLSMRRYLGSPSDLGWEGNPNDPRLLVLACIPIAGLILMGAGVVALVVGVARAAQK